MVKQSVSIRVIVRFRPENKIEKAKAAAEGGHRESIIIKGNQVSVSKRSIPDPPGPWRFDSVLDPMVDQEAVFEGFGRDTIDEVLRGYNGTVLSYGQTGSGKTFTIFGEMASLTCPLRGLIPRCVDYLFERLAVIAEVAFVKVNFIEIYKEKLQDLLSQGHGAEPTLRQRKNGTVFMDGAEDMFVSSFADVYQLLQYGFKQRHVACTKMNSVSSRSHCVLRFTIKQENKGEVKESVLNFADLAGSERIEKTGATGAVLEEAKKINQSLSALGNVINALSSKKKDFVPFRDSKLTWMLKDSLGGNTKTTLVTTGSLAKYNLEETISTLRFASRVKDIKCNVKANVQIPRKQLMDTIRKLNKNLDKSMALNLKYRTLLEKNGIDLPSWALEDVVSRQNTVTMETIDNANGSASVLVQGQEFLNDSATTPQPSVTPLPDIPHDLKAIDTEVDAAEGVQDNAAELQKGHSGPATPPFRNSLMLASIQLHKTNTAKINQMSNLIRKKNAEIEEKNRRIADVEMELVLACKSNSNEKDHELVEKKGQCKGLMIRFKAIEEHLEDLIRDTTIKKRIDKIQECFEALRELECDISQEEATLEQGLEDYYKMASGLRDQAVQKESYASKFGVLLEQYEYLVDQIRQLHNNWKKRIGDSDEQETTLIAETNPELLVAECNPFPIEMLKKNGGRGSVDDLRRSVGTIAAPVRNNGEMHWNKLRSNRYAGRSSQSQFMMPVRINKNTTFNALDTHVFSEGIPEENAAEKKGKEHRSKHQREMDALWED